MIFLHFRKEIDANWHPKLHQKRTYLRKAIFLKIVPPLQREHDFLDSGDLSWEQKYIKNRSENRLQHKEHHRINFWWILLDFRRQVGEENRAKIDTKRCRKAMKRKRATRWQKNRSKIDSKRGDTFFGGDRGRPGAPWEGDIGGGKMD